MLFAITGWIIVCTILGVLVVCVFRLCETSQDEKTEQEEMLKRPPETNHYEPLKRQLKEAEAGQPDAVKDSRDSVAETKATEINIEPEERKPLNTQQGPDDLREVAVSTGNDAGGQRHPRVAEIGHANLEARNNVTTPASAGDRTVDATNNSRNVSLPPAVKAVVVVAATAAAATVAAAASAPRRRSVVVDQEDVHKSPEESHTYSADIPNEFDCQKALNNDVPVPYIEIESAALPIFSSNGGADDCVTESSSLVEA